MSVANFFLQAGRAGIQVGRALGGWLMGGWWRPRGTRPQNLREWASLQVEKIRTSMSGGTLVFLTHYDQITDETPEARAAYRKMLRESTIKAALLTKVLSVSALSLQVHPKDKTNPEHRRQADFVRWAFSRVKGRHTRLARLVLLPALIDGWSLNEKVWTQEEDGDWKGKWTWEAWKSKDTMKADLGLDNYRNVQAVRATVNNSGRLFDPDDFVLYSHMDLFENPYGMSDLRAAYRAFWIKDSVWKLRGIHLDRFASPFLKGEYPPGASDVREALEEALAQAKASSWLTIPVGAAVEAIEMSTRGTADYESAIQDCDREMLIGITGSYLQILEGKTTGARAMGEVHQDTSELLQWMLAEELSQVFTREADELVRLNFAEPACPTITLESISQEALLARSQVDINLKMLGLPLSLREAYEVYGRSEPSGPDDVLGGPGPKPPGPKPDPDDEMGGALVPAA